MAMSLTKKQLFVQGGKLSETKVLASATGAREFYEDVIRSPSKSVDEKQSFACQKVVGPFPKTCRLSPLSLQKAAQEGDIEMLLNCLKNGVDVNSADDYGWTPIMIGTFSGSIACVQALLKHGASTSILSKGGDTCYSLAIKRGRKDIALLFEDEPNKMDEPPIIGIEKNELSFFCEDCNVFVSSRSHRSSITHQLKANQFSNIKTQYGLSEHNKGFQMLLDKGWDRNHGLGTLERRGPKFPVKTVLKRDRTGLGFLPRSKAVARVSHFKPFDSRSVKDVKRKRKRKI